MSNSKNPNPVIPAQAGIQQNKYSAQRTNMPSRYAEIFNQLDFRLRGNDNK